MFSYTSLWRSFVFRLSPTLASTRWFHFCFELFSVGFPWSCWQLLPSFYKQHTGIACVSWANLVQPKTAVKVLVVMFTAHELRAGGLDSVDAVVLSTLVCLWLVKTKHVFFWTIVSMCSSIHTVWAAPRQLPPTTHSVYSKSSKLAVFTCYLKFKKITKSTQIV